MLSKETWKLADRALMTYLRKVRDSFSHDKLSDHSHLAYFIKVPNLMAKNLDAGTTALKAKLRKQHVVGKPNGNGCAKGACSYGKGPPSLVESPLLPDNCED